MQRMKFSLACLLCLTSVCTVSAQTALESDLGVATLEDYSGGVSYGGAYFDVRTMTGDGVGYRNGYTQLGVVAPYWISEDMYFAPNARLLITDTSEVGTNVGGLLRRYSSDWDRVFGVYGYYDFDHSFEGFDYSQIAFGFDTLGTKWDARFNAYIPTTDDVNFVRALSVGSTPLYQGNSLGFIGQGLFQEAVSGADFEFGLPLTKRTPWLRGFAGAYFYENAGGPDPIGVRARMEAWVSDDLSVGVNVTDDDAFGTNVNAVVDFRFSGWKPTRYFPQWTTRERMMMPVQRNWRVNTPNVVNDVFVAGKNPDTGADYFIVHVDATNAGPGDGTAENPFSSLPSAAPGADIILVQADGTSIINPLRGNITLTNNQRLLGEGKAHTADVLVCFDDIIFESTIALPGIAADGNFPFMTSRPSPPSSGNIVTIASNNEVSAFNLVRADGFAITNSALLGSHNFDLNCLNITGNNGGIFLTNATGTGIIRDVNALNNTTGGISIESGVTALGLTVTDVVSSSAPAGGQAFGIELIADPGTINATLNRVQLNRNVDGLLLTGTSGDLNVTITDASIDDSTNDGVRITGTSSDIALNVARTTVNRSGGEGIQGTTTGGSLSILGRNVTVNNSGSDNLQLTMTNTDMDIDFRNATFNNSVGGSGLVVSNTGGSGGGTLVLDNVTSTGNFLDGLFFSGDNFTQIDAAVTTSIFSNNGRDAFSVSATDNAQVGLDVRAVVATGSGRHGLNFNATTDAILDITMLASNMNFSGSDAALAGNGVNGFADDATVDLTMVATSAANSGNNGMFVTAQNSADVTISVNQGNFQNSGQNTAGGDAVHIVTDTGANVVMQINNTPMNNTVVPGTQDDGLVFDSSGSSTVLANVSNSSLSDNLSNAIQATVDTSASVTLNLLNVVGERSGEDGILFDVQTAGQLTINSQTASFDDSGAGGTGDGVDGFIRTDGDVTFNWIATTVRRSAENGLLLDISDTGSSFNASIQSGDFSDSGEAMLGVNQQDAFHITAANDALVDIAMLNTPSRNSFTPPMGTQQRGLWANISSGADLIFDNQSGDMSNNLLNALNVTVLNAGSTADINLQATPANNSGEDGFIFNVTDFGDLVATFTDSTLDSSGSLGGIGDDFDAIDGVIDTDGSVLLFLTNTPVTNANNDGMQIVASNRGQFAAVFNNSALDFSGTNNSGDAIRLDFSSDADGVVILLNNSTATNAGDDAVFVTATDLGTTVSVTALTSDFSDSGLTPSAGGGNGIRALVTLDADVSFNIVDTPVTNTIPTTPQVRGMFFDVTAGGQLSATFDNSDLSGHDLHGIEGYISGTGVMDSSATITLTDTLVDFNVLFGGVFDVSDEGDLTIITTGASSLSGNGLDGLLVNVDGFGTAAGDTTFTFSLDGATIDNNGSLVGNGMTVFADNGAAIFGDANNTSISSNGNRGFELTLDNMSTADIGVTTTGFVNTTIDGNNNEGVSIVVDNGSELDFSMVGGSVSNNGAAGTAGDLLDSFDNVSVEAFNASDVEVQFVQTTVDGATRNGFNFLAEDSIFLAQLRAGTTASGNAGGNGVRFNADGPTTQAVLFMSDASADGMLTGTNAFNNNGTATINDDGTNTLDGFPQTGAGVFFNATNVDVAGFRFSGDASNNGNAADPLATRDIDGDGDGDDDGVFVNIDTANLAAVEFTGVGMINNNVDDAIDLHLTNITLLDTVTQPSDLTPPDVTIGAAGPGILVEDLTMDGNGGGLKLTLDGIDLNNNDIVIRNNTITNNTTDHGVTLVLSSTTNVDNILFDTNVITGNGLDGVHLEFMNSDVATMEFDGNNISGNGVANVAGEGNGVHYAVVNPSSIGPVLFTDNTIANNAEDGVRVVNVAPVGGLWDFTFDQNVAIDSNGGFGINFTLPNGLADLNLVMTDNASISGNTLGGVNLALDQNNTLTMTSFYGNRINNNGGPGVLLTADDGSSFTWNLGDSGQALNLFDNNDDAGVAIDITGTSTGTLVVENTTISSTNDGTTYFGDGLAIRLNEFATLNNMVIGDGTVNNTTFTGNAGDGVGIIIDAATSMTNALVQNSTFTNNGEDGLNVSRQGSGVIGNNFVITNNVFTGNADGIDIQAVFANLVDGYNINNNTITGNNQNGIRFSAQGDGQISTVLTDNTIENNLDDGVNISTVTVSAGDAAIVTSGLGTWTGNSFSFNGNSGADAGIDINGIHNISIGVNDANPLTFSNTINGNTGDGVEVTGTGTLTIVDADISFNNTEGSADGRAGVDINSTAFNVVSISNSRIFQNLGDGVEIDNTNLNGSSYTLFDNIISFNGRDGVEFVDTGNATLTINGTNTTTSQITDNGTSGTGGRGVDIIVGGSDLTNSTVSIQNTSVLRNDQEGVYVILTSSNTQRNAANRDSLASVALQSDGAIGTTPFLTFNMGNVGGNIVNDNGQSTGNIGGSGLVMRVGTTRGGDGFTTAGGFAGTANGGVVANVQNNSLNGNFGADVFIQSFVSTVDPATTGGTWTDQNEAVRNNANDVFNPTGYQSDPLARLDLTFSNNTGEENAGTNVGASYNNSEAVFKSRTQGQDNATDAPVAGADDDGPFGTGTRARNAQRLAARNVDAGGTQLPPLLTIGASNSFLFPGVGQSTFRVNNQAGAGNVFGAGNGFITDAVPFISTVGSANGVGPAGGGPEGIDAVPFGWTIFP